MLEQEKIDQIARKVADANLPKHAVTRVSTALTTDSQGRDALQITIVLEPDAVPKITGDAALDTLVQIHDNLRKAGDDRFPIIEYATEAELQDSGDS